jgi:hypothetical protein
VIPRNPVFNIYLHEFLRSDDDRALHDHQWVNCSILLHGEYIEHLRGGAQVRRRGGDVVFRLPCAAHRIELPPSSQGSTYAVVASVWTLFITGPRVREWGFWCGQRWVHWREFTAAGDSGTAGPGCEP